MHGNRSPGRAVVTEVLAVNFVVSCKIIHAHQVRSHFHDVLETGLHARQNLAHVFDHGSGLHANIKMRGSKFVTSAPAIVLSARRALVPDTIRKSPARFTCGYFPRGFAFPAITLLSTFPMC